MEDNYWCFCLDCNYGFVNDGKGDTLKDHKGHSFTLEYYPNILKQIIWKIRNKIKIMFRK